MLLLSYNFPLALQISRCVSLWETRRQHWLLSVLFMVSRMPESPVVLSVLDIPAGRSLLYVTILLGERQHSALPSMYRSWVVPPVMFW